MIQLVNTERIVCESCGQEHDSQVLAFPKTIYYKGQKLSLSDFYHSCPNNKVFYKTSRDVNETFKMERHIKKEIDKQIEMYNQSQQNVNVQWMNR